MLKVKQKKKRYSIVRSVAQFEAEFPGLPEEGMAYKIITTGQFSAISVILHFANAGKINNLYVSTFRVGKKELTALYGLHARGLLEACTFVVGKLMQNPGNYVGKYAYYDHFEKMCIESGWRQVAINNHSKLILLDTESGKYVVETSSNLNENPKIEQFSIEKDSDSFEYYRNVFEGWVANGNQ